MLEYGEGIASNVKSFFWNMYFEFCEEEEQQC